MPMGKSYKYCVYTNIAYNSGRAFSFKTISPLYVKVTVEVGWGGPRDKSILSLFTIKRETQNRFFFPQPIPLLQMTFYNKPVFGGFPQISNIFLFFPPTSHTLPTVNQLQRGFRGFPQISNIFYFSSRKTCGKPCMLTRSFCEAEDGENV